MVTASQNLRLVSSRMQSGLSLLLLLLALPVLLSLLPLLRSLGPVLLPPLLLAAFKSVVGHVSWFVVALTRRQRVQL